MGLYETHVLPRVVELTCGGADMLRWRRRTTEGLDGRIVEIGFGSGLNLPAYPDEVTQVLAVEPSRIARERSASRCEESGIPVEFVGLDGASIPLADDSCDGALATFVLCTIPDVATALSELRRVLVPGGAFHLLEHGRSPDDGVRAWQRRVEPVQQRLGGGCHLTRDPLVLVEDAGFEVLDVTQRYMRGPKPWTWFTLAKLRNPR